MFDGTFDADGPDNILNDDPLTPVDESADNEDPEAALLAHFDEVELVVVTDGRRRTYSLDTT